MRISFNQPSFIPWGGFFARLLLSDKMVLLDDTLLSTGFTFVNRNRIKGPEGEVWISVPVKKKGRGRQKIKDLELHEKERWSKDFLLTLRHFYVKSIYFPSIYKRIKEAVGTQEESFCGMVLKLLNILREEFGIEQNFILQSKSGISGLGTELLVSLARELGATEVILPRYSDKAVDCGKFAEEHIDVRFLRYDPLPYPQFWGKFIPRLSALDLLLCVGPEGKRILEKGSFMNISTSSHRGRI
jgi:hypothetical protein